ncbi:MAG: flagellar protein FliS [Cellulosilyticaceae bacterium]
MMTAATIAHASQIELLCLTYELFLEDIEQALACRGEVRKKRIAHGREVLLQLVESLNFEEQIAKELFQMYIYIQNILINELEKDDKLDEVRRLMRTIYEGYAQLMNQQVDALPVMNNAENIYVGMTYGKGYLSELVVGNSQRGFKA